MAGVTIGSAQYLIEVEQAGFQRGLAAAERTAQTAAGRIGQAFSGVGTTITRAFSGAFSGLDGIVNRAIGSAFGGVRGTVERSLGGVRQAVTGAFSGLPSIIGSATTALGSFGLAAAGIQAAVGAVRGIGSGLFGLGALNDFEQATAAINAFTKDGAVTARILEDVRTEAAKTPFAFNELAKATASLMPAARSANVPLMDLLKTAEILAASNPAEGLEGAAFALREALSGDYTSIIERFNLPRSEINKLKAEGVPALEAVRRVMQGMGFDADLISAKAATLSGRWSTFLDTITILQTRMGQPIFDALKTGLEALQRVLDENMPSLERFADLIATGLRNALSDIGPRVQTFARTFGQAFNTVSRVWREVSGLFGRGFGDTPTLNSLLSRMGFSDAAIRTIQNGIAGLGDVFVTLRQRAAPALEVLRQALSNLMAVASRLIVALSPIAEWLRARIGPAVDIAIRAFGAFQNAIRAALVLSEGQGFTGFISQLVTQLGGLGRRLMDEIGIQLGQIDWGALWSRMTTAASSFLTWAGGLFVTLAGWLVTWIGDQVAKVNWSAVWSRAVDVLGGMANWFLGLAGRLLTWIGDAVSQVEWRAVWLRVVDAMSGMVTLFIGLANKLTEWIGGEVTKIKWDEVWKQSKLTATMVMDGLFAFDLALGDWLDKQIKAVDWRKVGQAFGQEIAAAFTGGFKQATDTGGLQASTIRRMIGDFVAGVIEGAIDLPKIGKIFTNALKGAWGIAIAQAALDVLPKLKTAFLRLLESGWRLALQLFRPALNVRFTIDVNAWGRQILNALQGAWGFAIARAVLEIGANVIRTVTGGGSSTPPRTPTPNPGGASDGQTSTTPCPPGMVRTPAGCRWPDAYASGTRYVPRDGLAYLHKGEAVIPARENAARLADTSLLSAGFRMPQWQHAGGDSSPTVNAASSVRVSVQNTFNGVGPDVAPVVEAAMGQAIDRMSEALLSHARHYPRRVDKTQPGAA